MHVHSHSQGASSVANYAAGTTKSAISQSPSAATSSSFDPGATATTSQTSTASTASGATSSNPFTSLSTNIQALLLGVGQGAQNAAGTATSTASQALNAYNATSSFLSPASL
jgi:hypothetical protein